MWIAPRIDRTEETVNVSLDTEGAESGKQQPPRPLMKGGGHAEMVNRDAA